MAKTHYKKFLNPDYLGAYALEDGLDIILTIVRNKGSHSNSQMNLCIVGSNPTFSPLKNCQAVRQQTIIMSLVYIGVSPSGKAQDLSEYLSSVELGTNPKR